MKNKMIWLHVIPPTYGIILHAQGVLIISQLVYIIVDGAILFTPHTVQQTSYIVGVFYLLAVRIGHFGQAVPGIIFPLGCISLIFEPWNYYGSDIFYYLPQWTVVEILGT